MPKPKELSDKIRVALTDLLEINRGAGWEWGSCSPTNGPELISTINEFLQTHNVPQLKQLPGTVVIQYSQREDGGYELSLYLK